MGSKIGLGSSRCYVMTQGWQKTESIVKILDHKIRLLVKMELRTLPL